MQQIVKGIYAGGVPRKTLELVHMRASQITRLADHPDTATDEIWAGAAEHFDESALAALVSMAALTNYFNRVNTTLRIQPGAQG